MRVWTRCGRNTGSIPCSWARASSPTPRRSMTASADICRSASTSSCQARPRANGWASRCFWGRSIRGSRREGQRHALCMRWGADVTRALEEKHQGHGQHVWGPSLHGNRADTPVSALRWRGPQQRNVTTMMIPHRMLSPEALRGVIEAFITREGTDYGLHEVPLATKVGQVRYQLDMGTAVIVYDEATDSCTIQPTDQRSALP